MAKSFRCRLVTPEAQVFDSQASSAVVPVWDGLLGILPGRAPMVMQMGAGELRVDFADAAKGGSRAFFVNDGFVQMVGNELTILAANAVPAEKLSETEAQAELSAANARRTEGEPPASVERIRKARASAAAKVRAARSLGGRRG